MFWLYMCIRAVARDVLIGWNSMVGGALQISLSLILLIRILALFFLFFLFPVFFLGLFFLSLLSGLGGSLYIKFFLHCCFGLTFHSERGFGESLSLFYTVGHDDIVKQSARFDL